MSFGSGLSGSDDLLADAGYPVYRRLFSSDSDFVADLEQKLAQSRMPDPVELFLSRALMIGLIVGGVLWFIGVTLGYILFALGVVPVGTLLGMPISDPGLVALINALKTPLLIGITGLVLGSFGFGMGFGGLVMLPYLRVSERKREINMLLPDAISFMYALSIGGLNQLEIIESMAIAQDTYGEVAQEFQSIVQETEYFDTDYRTAIRQQSMETPSEELSQFLTDMLSIINSGGDMTSFLDDKKDKHMRTAKQQQEMTLETLELFGEMYMTLSLFPLLLIIVLVIMSMLGEADQLMLYATVYGLIPLTGAGFLVLVSTVKQDEVGDGYLSFENSAARNTSAVSKSPLSLGIVNAFPTEFSVFKQIKTREALHQFSEIAKAPHVLFRDYPLYTLGLTIPLAVILLSIAVFEGSAPTGFSGFVDRPVWSTFIWIYLPLYVIFVPLMVFYEWNVRSRHGVISGLSDNLRKLSSANDTGLTLLDSIQTVAATSPGSLARELDVIYSKVQYGMSLKDALIEFNNKYHIPRLARTVKLISKAQEASSQITSVLTTAAQASENQDDIDRERRSRTRMQVVIILMTYFTLLAVMAILKTQFLDVMAGLSTEAGGGGGGAPGGGSFGANIDAPVLSLLFFHAVTIQAVLSGFISGYIRDASLMSGVKFVVMLSTIALITWIVVG